MGEDDPSLSLCDEEKKDGSIQSSSSCSATMNTATNNNTTAHNTKQTLPVHRKSVSDVTINVTQDTEPTSPLTPEDRKRWHKQAERTTTTTTSTTTHGVTANVVDEDDSSHDDGSYFADPLHLPSPKSDRRFVVAAGGGGAATAAAAKKNTAVCRLAHRESDASLSLSDDSDDDEEEGNHHRHHHSSSSVINTPRAADVFPQQLTRIHSVSSLVSESSSTSFINKQSQEAAGKQVMNGLPKNASLSSSSSSSPWYHPQQQEQQQQQGQSSEQEKQQYDNFQQRATNGMQNTASSASSSSSSSSHHHHHNYDHHHHSSPTYQIYWQRWLMLFYMSLLNLLSDWTCYSVAPIAVMTEQAFGSINPEKLVVLFLAANAVSTACEPILLSRLGLRKTVLFGALLLMLGSIIKSGGTILPQIQQANLHKGHGEWRVYMGFFLVGLSQPLYQCTPALLSASWFPEQERTMATGVALNANQVGIGFAFIFGTLLVKTSDDIPQYFSLLSLLSTLAFLGTLIQFDDAPPTPPSNTAKVMRGTMEVNLPSIQTIFESVRNLRQPSPVMKTAASAVPQQQRSSKSSSNRRGGGAQQSGASKQGRPSEARSLATMGQNRQDEATLVSQQEVNISHRQPNRCDSTGSEPSSIGRVSVAGSNTTDANTSLHGLYTMPSPANWDDSVGRDKTRQDVEKTSDDDDEEEAPHPSHDMSPPRNISFGRQPAGEPPQHHHGMVSQPQQPQYQPVWDPRIGYYVYYPVNAWLPVHDPLTMYQSIPSSFYPSQEAMSESSYYHPSQSESQAYFNPHSSSNLRYYDCPDNVLPLLDENEQGVEPVLTLTPHHLDIEINDDQVWLSIKACMARPGFIHCLVSFTVSGIVINTLSTFMDHLVRLNGAGREYTGIVGGSFQFVIMIASLVMGNVTDKTRAYYSIIIGMLVMGAFGLAECGVNLDADKGMELRVSLIVVAALVGPLQPISTELGVETVYPLSENTVLVIQQLFSNLFSAFFIPCFKAFKNYGLNPVGDKDQAVQPEFTFSFYVLIVLHALATVFFATFNGRYLRHEQEEERNALERSRQWQKVSAADYGSLGMNHGMNQTPNEGLFTEQNPLLVSQHVV